MRFKLNMGSKFTDCPSSFIILVLWSNMYERDVVSQYQTQWNHICQFKLRLAKKAQHIFPKPTDVGNVPDSEVSLSIAVNSFEETPKSKSCTITPIQFGRILFWYVTVCRKVFWIPCWFMNAKPTGQSNENIICPINVTKEFIDLCAERKPGHSTKSVTVNQKCLTHVQGELSNNPKIPQRVSNTKYKAGLVCGADTLCWYSDIVKFFNHIYTCENQMGMICLKSDSTLHSVRLKSASTLFFFYSYLKINQFKYLIGSWILFFHVDDTS